jgi:hypothetical protein
MNFSPTGDSVPNAGNAISRIQAGAGEPPAPRECGLIPGSATAINAPLSQSLLRSGVRAYLETRRPDPNPENEPQLFDTLPKRVKAEIRALLMAFASIDCMTDRRRTGRISVDAACKVVSKKFRPDWNWSPKRLNARYSAFVRARDWTVLVNCSKAGAAWQDSRRGLPMEFLQYCCDVIFAYKRDDARKEALHSIKRNWMTGRNAAGEPNEIPGFGFRRDWIRRNDPSIDFPTGWTYSNILRQIKKHNILPRAVHLLTLQGTNAARKVLPQVNATRSDLRFMEWVEFDDVKVDWRVIDTVTGSVVDLWILIARDRATSVLLGFVMRPALVREDGSQTHLRLEDMKQLCGWVLEHYGLPPYLMTWLLENGTATLGQGVRAALKELLQGRLEIRYSSMVGGVSPSGFREKKIGNSMGKASLESHNRPIHIISSNIPGQTGPLYNVRPADLQAREAEAIRTWKLGQEILPPHLRNDLGYALLTVDQARAALMQVFAIQNNNTDHRKEGFEKIGEWFDPARGLWLPARTAPAVMPAGSSVRARMQTPLERAAQLVTGLSWTPVSPEIIAAFYEHTQRVVHVEENGEIVFRHNGKDLIFTSQCNPGQKLVAYLHSDDPQFLHLTDGAGRFFPSAVLKSRIKVGDQDALAKAIEFSQSALKAARQRAEELAAPERKALEAMRAHNAALLGEFMPTVAAPEASRPMAQSGVAAGLKAIQEQRKAESRATAAQAAEDRAAIARSGRAASRDILASAAPVDPRPAPSAIAEMFGAPEPEAESKPASNFLSTISNHGD